MDSLDDILKKATSIGHVPATPDVDKDPALTSEEVKQAKGVLTDAIEVAKTQDLAPANFERPRDVERSRKRLVMESAFKNFESAVGGRKVLIEALQFTPEASTGHKAAQRLLANRDFNSEKKFSLYAIASRGKIPLSALVVAFRDAKMAQMAVQSITAMADHAPEVVEQVALDAKNHYIPCHVCEGRTRVRKIGDNGEWLKNEQGEFQTQLCYNCRGTGKVFKDHDPASRTHFLKITGILEDRRAPLVDMSKHQNVLAMDFKPGDGGFEKLIKAVDVVVGVNKQDEDVVEVPYAIYEEESDAQDTQEEHG